jgi:hypothetical protein
VNVEKHRSIGNSSMSAIEMLQQCPRGGHNFRWWLA